MRWLKRLFLAAIALTVISAIVYAFLPKPVPADFGTVERGVLLVTVDEDGKTRIKERYVVSAPLAGHLLRIKLRPGDAVVAGETVLATIEPGDPELLDARALAQAEARVKAAEAALLQAGTNLERGRVALQNAESELSRAQQLVKRKVITEQEYEDAQVLLRIRTEEFKAARFAEEIARFELEQARAALVRSRPQSEGETTEWNIVIRSPITGRVLRLFQESAAIVTPGTALMEVGNPQDLEVEIDVLSSDAVKIQPGNKILLEEWGGEEPLVGIVRLIEPSAFTKISALGVEEQRVWVIGDFTGPPENRRSLGDGFRVEARIVVWEGNDILKVPTSALFRHGDDWAVFRVNNNRAELRIVKVGRRNDLEAEILDGLQEGDRLILHPSDKISDGVAVVAR